MSQIDQPTDAGSLARQSRRAAMVRGVASRVPDEVGVLVALVVIVLVIGIPHANFVKPYNLLQVIGSSSFYGMIALGMVFLLALGEIDLSVGWNFNFSAVITAKAMMAGINPWIAALLGILFGAGLGLVNGLLTVGLRLPSIIVTLGTYSMFLGLSLVVNKSLSVGPDPEKAVGGFFGFTGA